MPGHEWHEGNPEVTFRQLTSQQWEAAYRDLKKTLESKIAFLEQENQTLRLERDKAIASWADHPGQHGC